MTYRIQKISNEGTSSPFYARVLFGLGELRECALQAKFTTYQGLPIHPSVVTCNFKKLAERANLKGVRFHDLRHTFASLMLLRGAPVKVISEALGHSSTAFTMDTYSHIIEGMQEDAMALLDEILPVGNIKSNHYSLTTTIAN